MTESSETSADMQRITRHCVPEGKTTGMNAANPTKVAHSEKYGVYYIVQMSRSGSSFA